jgi:hypothetical protein
MPDPSPVLCLFCHKPLHSDELAVFRGGAKIAHLGCWRPGPTPTPSTAAVDTSELASTGGLNGQTPNLRPGPNPPDPHRQVGVQIPGN